MACADAMKGGLGRHGGREARGEKHDFDCARRTDGGMAGWRDGGGVRSVPSEQEFLRTWLEEGAIVIWRRREG